MIQIKDFGFIWKRRFTVQHSKKPDNMALVKALLSKCYIGNNSLPTKRKPSLRLITSHPAAMILAGQPNRLKKGAMYKFLDIGIIYKRFKPLEAFAVTCTVKFYSDPFFVLVYLPWLNCKISLSCT